VSLGGHVLRVPGLEDEVTATFRNANSSFIYTALYLRGPETLPEYLYAYKNSDEF
jgi:hypothetical protein